MPPLCGVKRFAGGKTLQRLCRCQYNRSLWPSSATRRKREAGAQSEVTFLPENPESGTRFQPIEGLSNIGVIRFSAFYWLHSGLSPETIGAQRFQRFIRFVYL